MIDLLRKYRDRWTKIALSTSETDFANVFNAVQRAYLIRKQKMPSDIILVDSPFACLFIYALFNEKSLRLKDKIRGYLHPHFASPLTHRYNEKSINYPPLIHHEDYDFMYQDLTLHLAFRLNILSSNTKWTLRALTDI